VFLFLRRRIIYSLVALLGVTIAVFFLGRLNGSPALVYLPVGASKQQIDLYNHQHGFDQPLPTQFWQFLVSVVHFDFGESLSQQKPASQVIFEALPQTLLLAGVALLITLIFALFLGTVSAMKPFGNADRSITFVSLAIGSVPDFWFALVCIMFFAVFLRLVPTAGVAGPSSWILPVATLALAPIGGMTQVVRGAMIEALGSGYVQNARARGFGRWRLAFRHSLRNAALPIVTFTGDRAVHLFNGTIIVSSVFAWPGIGYQMVNGVLNRDFPVVQAGVFIIGLMVVIINIVIDFAYALIDPRVRVS
jgi:peptide/nickel transport system permease protein